MVLFYTQASWCPSRMAETSPSQREPEYTTGRPKVPSTDEETEASEGSDRSGLLGLEVLHLLIHGDRVSSSSTAVVQTLLLSLKIVIIVKIKR